MPENERPFTRSTGKGRRSTDKRERILRAAIEVFARKGFYATRVSEIAEAAGVADGTIYLYFKNKDDVLISLFEDRMDLLIARFRETLAGVTTTEEGLRRLIHLHLELVAAEPTLAEVLTVELRQSAKFMREYKATRFAEYLSVWQELIERGRAAGEIREDIDPALSSLVLFGALDEVSLQWVSSRRRPYELEQAAQQIWNICAGGMFPSGDTSMEQPELRRTP